ncbi:hypothetical protein D3C86_1681810 [compost metagenome]
MVTLSVLWVVLIGVEVVYWTMAPWVLSPYWVVELMPGAVTPQPVRAPAARMATRAAEKSLDWILRAWAIWLGLTMPESTRITPICFLVRRWDSRARLRSSRLMTSVATRISPSISLTAVVPFEWAPCCQVRTASSSAAVMTPKRKRTSPSFSLVRFCSSRARSS